MYRRDINVKEFFILVGLFSLEIEETMFRGIRYINFPPKVPSRPKLPPSTAGAVEPEYRLYGRVTLVRKRPVSCARAENLSRWQDENDAPPRVQSLQRFNAKDSPKP